MSDVKSGRVMCSTGSNGKMIEKEKKKKKRKKKRRRIRQRIDQKQKQTTSLIVWTDTVGGRYRPEVTSVIERDAQSKQIVFFLLLFSLVCQRKTGGFEVTGQI